MKKILVAITLVLVAAMLMAVPTFGAIDNAQVSVEELIKWDVLGEHLHYVGEATTTPPVQDGKINEGEYTYTYRLTDPIFMCDENFKKLAYNEYTDFSSNYIEFSFSYDDDYVYVGIYDDQFYKDGTNKVHNCNLYPDFGLNLEDVSKLDYPQITNSGSLNNKTQNMSDTSGTAGKYVPYEDYDNRYRYADGHMIKRIDTLFATKIDDGFGGVDAIYELKYSKADMLAMFNGCDGSTTPNGSVNLGPANNDKFPNAFLFGIHMTQYSNQARDGVLTYVRWNGKALTNIDKLNLGTNIDFVPAVIVLGSEGTNFLGNDAPAVSTEAPTTEAPTEAPTTEAPTEAPTTEAPVTEAPTNENPTEAPETAPATEAPETEAPAEGGCGGYVGTMGIALVAALGTCAVVVSKKRKED